MVQFFEQEIHRLKNEMLKINIQIKSKASKRNELKKVVLNTPKNDESPRAMREEIVMLDKQIFYLNMNTERCLKQQQIYLRLQEKERI